MKIHPSFFVTCHAFSKSDLLDVRADGWIRWHMWPTISGRQTRELAEREKASFSIGRVRPSHFTENKS